MKGCIYIRKRIDQADKPNLLSFEVTEHIAQCEDCERFAGERTALRKLVESSTRVSAPMNFDAILNARLGEVKARRSFWWLSSPGYLRLGAATAGLLVMIFAAQYAGLFSDHSNRAGTPPGVASTPPRPDETKPASSPPPALIVRPSSDLGDRGAREAALAYTSPVRSLRARRGDIAVSRIAPPGYLSAEDGGVVLVRGQNGDMDVQMPTVSVGAQSLLYVRGSQRAVRNVGTSF